MFHLSVPVFAAQTWNHLLVNQRKLFVVLFLFRVFHALIQQTSFVPDEFWQSIEVAHRWAFGYGSLTWEWRHDVALRSPLHPMLIVPFFWLGKLIHVDSARFILLVPRLLHALLATVADLHIYRLSTKLAGLETAKWVLFHQLSNWFTAFCAPRPLANCLEWALTIIALANYPIWSVIHNKSKGIDPPERKFIFFAVGCVILRPTAAIIWGPLCLIHVLITYSMGRNKFGSGQSRRRKIPVYRMIYKYCIWGLFWLVCSILADRWAFGRWTINQWNFLQFNLFGGGSHVYGVHPWHWYLSQGLPAMLLTQIPFVILGLYTDWYAVTREQRTVCRFLATLFLWTVFCYSLLGHKEFRFLFHLLPVAMYFCARGTQFLLEYVKNRSLSTRAHTTTTISTILVFFILGTQLPVLFYISLVHQRGTLDSIGFVAQAIDKQQQESPYNIANHSPNPDAWFVLSLMPCHSLPPVGFLHRNITLRQLNCDPDLSGWFGASEPHFDEADQFFTDPRAWLVSHFNPATSQPADTVTGSPHFILFFDSLLLRFPQVENLLLTQWNYHQCGRFFHAHFLTHRHYGHFVLVFCRSDLTV